MKLNVLALFRRAFCLCVPLIQSSVLLVAFALNVQMSGSTCTVNRGGDAAGLERNKMIDIFLHR